MNLSCLSAQLLDAIPFKGFLRLVELQLRVWPDEAANAPYDIVLGEHGLKLAFFEEVGIAGLGSEVIEFNMI